MTMTFLFKEKIEKIVTEIYRGSKVNFEKKAQTQIAQIVQNGWDKLPICMAKTQYTVSQIIQMHLEHLKTLKLPFVNWYQN